MSGHIRNYIRMRHIHKHTHTHMLAYTASHAIPSHHNTLLHITTRYKTPHYDTLTHAYVHAYINTYIHT